MKKTNRGPILAMIIAIGMLSGCESFGVPQAESFNDRVGYALGSHTAVVESITAAVSLGEISSDEAQGAAEIADKARSIIDTARRVHSAGDIEGASRQLSLAITILQELQAHLRRGGGT